MKKALLICGSHNQTSMMHKISQYLESDFECFFTPFYADGIIDWLGQRGLLEFSILGVKECQGARDYLEREGLRIDYRGLQDDYDLVITGTDNIIQSNIRDKPIVLVQEGMMEEESWVFPLVKHLGLPGYLANTAGTGLSDAYDVFCVASEGYREDFIRKGIISKKIVVTGIPNFDDIASYLENDFPYHDYVLAATSPLRETFRIRSDRKAFIQKVKRIAKGRPVIFKLHPLEKVDRARREIIDIIPGAIVLAEGNTEHMIANCQVLVTQTSSVTFIGVVLGKEVYTDLNLEKLEKLQPIQNGGKSASHVADVCRQLVHNPESIFSNSNDQCS